MSNLNQITMITIYLLIGYFNVNNLELNPNSIKTDEFKTYINKVLRDGSMGGFIDYGEFEQIINFIKDNFPNIIETFPIGKTQENRNITAVKISSNEKYQYQKSAMLFTGMHHAREPASMMMNLYLIFFFIDAYIKNNTIITELLHNSEMYFIPIINVDGFVKNNKIYSNYGDFEKCMQRKNLNRGSRTIFCNRNTDYGVDLNRNYGFKFNYDQEGASNHPCDEDYRGSFAFSEPETQAIRDFIESDIGKRIKIAFNYHSYGNLLIMPFNFDDANSKLLPLNYTQQYHVYSDFIQEGHFPDRFKYGNGKKTIEYKANGESSDWMLGMKKIVSFSPELGTSNLGSNNFYPNLDLLLEEVLPQNSISALYAIQRSGYFLRFFTLKNNYLECSIITNYQHKFMDQSSDEKMELKVCRENSNMYQFSNTIALKNTGFSDYRGKVKIKLLVNLTNVKYISVKSDSGSNYKTDNSQGYKANSKRDNFEKNITEVIRDYKIGNLTSLNNDTFSSENIFFEYNTTYYTLIELEAENIDSQNFFLIDMKIYYDKYLIDKYFEENKIWKKNQENNVKNSPLIDIFNSDSDEYLRKYNHPENETFKKLDFAQDFLVSAFLENEFLSISDIKLKEVSQVKEIKQMLNNKLHLRYLNEDNSFNSTKKIEDSIKANRLYFANDNYNIKINQFEIFEINKKPNNDFSIIDGFIDLFLYSSLMLMLILFILFTLFKTKMYCKKRELTKRLNESPDSARSTSLGNKRYMELNYTSDNSISIRRDGEKFNKPTGLNDF